jgi:hypothetical protein
MTEKQEQKKKRMKQHVVLEQVQTEAIQNAKPCRCARGERV